VDENLPRETCVLEADGHEAITVEGQGLGGADDGTVYRVCQTEERGLITLDLGFANVQAYEPKASSGVIVLRLARQDKEAVLAAVTRMLPVLAEEPLARRLWIVEEERIRIRA
jgi:predicted nuclease of predicted toxin-antitoxin system